MLDQCNIKLKFDSRYLADELQLSQTILISLKTLFGETGSAAAFQILKFDTEEEELVLQCSSIHVRQLRAALAVFAGHYLRAEVPYCGKE